MRTFRVQTSTRYFAGTGFLFGDFQFRNLLGTSSDVERLFWLSICGTDCAAMTYHYFPTLRNVLAVPFRSILRLRQQGSSATFVVLAF